MTINRSENSRELSHGAESDQLAKRSHSPPGGDESESIDDDTAGRIIEAIKRGNTRVASAAAAGVSRSTFCDWCRRGRKDEEPFASFVDAIRRAEAHAEMKFVKEIRLAGVNAWKAYAWLLERRHPEWRSPELKLRAKLARAARVSPTRPEHQISKQDVEARKQELRDELDLLDSQLP